MDIKIFQGEAYDQLRLLKTRSVNTIVTSVPYFQVRDYGHDDQIGLEATPQLFIDRMVKIFREARRVLRGDGTLWLNIGDSYSRKGGREPHKSRHWFKDNPDDLSGMQEYRQSKDIGLRQKNLIGIPWKLAFAMQEDGWYLRSDIIWAKPNPMPESCNDRPTKSHEYVFLFSKNAKYYFDYQAIAEPMTQEEIAKTFRGGSYTKDNAFENQSGAGQRSVAGNIKVPSGWDTAPGSHGTIHREGRSSNGSKPASSDSLWSKGLRRKRDVWTIASQPSSEEFYAAFPEKLIEPCILAGCPPGGTVLDPFGGTGTTGIVANKLDRKAILIELVPKTIELAKKKITSELGLFSSINII